MHIGRYLDKAEKLDNLKIHKQSFSMSDYLSG